MENNERNIGKKYKRLRDTYGPWAVVTGASDGIGQAFARYLGNTGLNLILVARRRDVLDPFAKALSTDHGIETMVIDADLSENAGVQRIVEETRHVDIGLLVASAGFGTSGSLIDSPLKQEVEMLHVNCRAVLSLAHVFGRRFAQRKGGGIVLMSSLVGFQGVPRAANYAATKAYVQSLAEGLSIELAPHNVDVLASAPGPVHSGFARRANMQMSLALEPETVVKATLSALGHRHTVRPGWLSKVLEWSLTLPRWARVRIMNIVMSNMTKH